MPSWAMTPPAGCAVGSYKFKGNIANADRVSTSRARDELARQLDVKVKSMIKDYIEEGESNGKDFTEELTQSVSKQVASMSLSGTVAKKERYAKRSLSRLFAWTLKPLWTRSTK